MQRHQSDWGRIPRAGLFLFPIAFFLFAGLTPTATAGVAAQLVADSLDYPVFATSPPGNSRLFIVEQKGVIKILQNGHVLPTPFLDIHTLVFPPSEFEERGLLGLAFHPNYASNGFFYVMYNNLSWDTVIARYRRSSSNQNRADPTSAFILLTIDQPAPNHKGGTLEFGPNDGYLYIGMGDGGGEGDPSNYAQRDDSLLGKMLRIDVNGPAPYGIPPSNPYAAPGLPLDEIWARGFRNPYRYSFDRANGDLYIGDVGQQFWEEIDFQPASSPGGENYGWHIMEGNHCYDPPEGCSSAGLVLPIHEYQHIFHCAVVGGYVYRGSVLSGETGNYFFADYCTATLWSFRYQTGVISNFTERTDELSPNGEIEWISAFAQDAAGELYVIERGISPVTGEIWKIVPGTTTTAVDAGTTPPAAALALAPASPNPFSSRTRIDLSLGSEPLSLRARVYTAAGRFVDELAAERAGLGNGRAAFEWDGRDAQGLECPSGVYVLRVAADGHEARQRLVLVR